MEKINLATYILAACALVVVGLLIRKEFFLDQYSVPEPIMHISETDTLDLGGIQIGTDDAEVTIIEFFDYECPYCKKFQESVDYIIENFEERVQVKYVHFPLSNHENAFEAALAAECANRQNRFSDTHEYLFRNQYSLNETDWEVFSEELNMPDGQNFIRCLENRETAASVEKGRLAAEKLGISSIPTYLVNGKMYQGVMPPELLEGLVQLELE